MSHSDKSSLAYCLTIFVCHNGTLRVDYVQAEGFSLQSASDQLCWFEINYSY
jgi:hypothetical protein